MNNRIKILLLIFIFLLSFSELSFSQLREPSPIQFFIKGGISAGGSKAAKFSSGKSSSMLFDPSFGGGLAFNFTPSFQILAEALYITKGVNCRMEYNEDLEKAYQLSVNAPNEVDNAVNNNVPIGILWSKNSYVEFPLTLSYTYCEGLFRTRIGGYFAYAVRRSGEFVIIEQGKESTQELDMGLIRKYVKRRDMGLKIINEFYIDNFSFSFECSSGLRYVINPRDPHDNRRSYNMTVWVYLNIYF